MHRHFLFQTLAVCSLAVLPRASATACSAITENLLTSVGCPANCGENAWACILFSPFAQGNYSQCADPLECHAVDGYTAPALGVHQPCSLQYACIRESYQSSQIAMSFVSKAQNLSYPSDLTQIYLLGPSSDDWEHPHPEIHHLSLDHSVFETPPTIDTLYVDDLDLHDQLDGVTLSSTLTTIEFVNANLSAVPEQLDIETSALAYLRLGYNSLDSLPPYASFRNLISLSLMSNRFTGFDYSFPQLIELNLDNNPLTEFPMAIFDLPVLGDLTLDGCGLTNVHLTRDQLEFLSYGLRYFSADFTVTECRDGYEQKPVSRRNMFDVFVCVESDGSDEGSSEASGSDEGSSAASGSNEETTSPPIQETTTPPPPETTSPPPPESTRPPTPPTTPTRPPTQSPTPTPTTSVVPGTTTPPMSPVSTSPSPSTPVVSTTPAPTTSSSTPSRDPAASISSITSGSTTSTHPVSVAGTTSTQPPSSGWNMPPTPTTTTPPRFYSYSSGSSSQATAIKTARSRSTASANVWLVASICSGSVVVLTVVAFLMYRRHQLKRRNRRAEPDPTYELSKQLMEA